MATLDWNHEAIDQLAFHWQFLRPALDGLTDEELLWEPVGGMVSLRRRDAAATADVRGAGEWVVELPPREPEQPPMSTIAWRLAHVAIDIFGVRASNHFGDGSFHGDSVEWEPTADFALALLDDQYERWMDGVRSLDDAGMGRAVGPAEGPFAASPYATLVLHLNRETIHHGAEVSLLRDLYRNRATLTSSGAIGS